MAPGLELTVLASGSRGNAAAIVTARRRFLVDLGISPRDARRRLAASGAPDLESITDLVVTHFDRDHFHPGWGRPLAASGWRVWVHPRHLAAARKLGVPETSLRPTAKRIDLGDGLALEPVRTPHDERGSTAWIVEARDGSDAVRLGWATDLGRVPEALLERFRDLDALALESNYDPLLQLRSRRPEFLKARITGGRGHLSNDESLAAALRIADAGELQALVLLHLSRECNCPELVRELWRERAPQLEPRLAIAAQDAPLSPLRIAARRRAAAPSLFTDLVG